MGKEAKEAQVIISIKELYGPSEEAIKKTITNLIEECLPFECEVESIKIR